MKMRKNVKMAPHREETPGMDRVQLIAARKIAFLTKDEVERFFASIPSANLRDQLLFDVIYRHGLRRQEAGLIRRGEHFVDGKVWITRVKGGISGLYKIHPRTRRLLWAYLNERGEDGNPHLFRSRHNGGGPLSSAMIYHLFRRYAELAGLPKDRCHPHVLRHSIAVHLMNAGWDVSDVQDWLGHRDITSTMIYAAVTNKRREAKYEAALLSEEIANNAN
jgi:site-specific recombinase XerD